LKRLLSFWLFSRVLNFPRKKKKVNSRRKTLAKSERVFAAKSAGNRAFSPRPEEKNQQQIAKTTKSNKKNQRIAPRGGKILFDGGAKSTFKIYYSAAAHNVIQQTHSVTFKRARDTHTHSKTDGRKDARARSLSL
jgi:hypothetical protein